MISLAAPANVSHSKRVISKHNSERENHRRDRPFSQLYYGKEDSSAVILPNKSLT